MTQIEDVLARLRAVKAPSELSRHALVELPPFGERGLDALAAAVEKAYDADASDFHLVLKVAATRIHADAARSPDPFWTQKIQDVLLYFHDHDRFGPLRPAFEQAFFALPAEAQVRLAHCLENAWSAGLVVAFLPRLPDAWPILLGRIEHLRLERFSNLGEMLGSALVSLGPDVVPLVLERLGRASADGSEVFARALAVLRTSDAMEGLVSLLGHSSKSVRATALELLRGLGQDARAALEMGASSKKKLLREASVELLSKLEATADNPLEAQLAEMRRDAKREFAAREAYERIADAPRLSAETMDALGIDLAALVWEELCAQPENYKPWGGLRAVAIAASGRPDVARYAAISAAGLARCRPTSPYYVKQIGKAVEPLGEALVGPLSAALARGDFPLRGLALELLLPHARDVAVDLWIAALGDPGKTIRQTAKEALVAHGEKAAAAIVPLLSAKKAEVRLAAAETLEAVATAELGAAIAEATARETDGKVKIVLERIASRMGASSQTKPSKKEDENEDVIALLSKTPNAKMPKILAGVVLPPVRAKDTQAALPEAARIGLVAHLMNEGPDMEDPMLRRVRKKLDDADASALSGAIFQAWQAAGSEAKHKWCVYQRAVLETREALCEVAHGLDIMTSGGHHHLAGWHLDCLARYGRVPGNEQTVDDCLSWVAHWAAEAETKSLEKHARTLIEKERSIRGLSPEDFRRIIDTHVADDDEDRRTPVLPIAPPPAFDFDGEKWQAVVSGKRLRLQNPEGALAAPPPGVEHAEEARRFADLARHVDDVLGREAKRLEEAMVGGREWLAPAFLRAAAHPVLGALLSGLVCLARDGKKEIWFRPAMTEFFDVRNRRVKIPLGAVITVPHRLEIPENTLAAWKKHFSDASIAQPFEQLDRKIFTEPEALDPLDRTMKRAALAARLREHGLRHGPPEDAGLFHYSYKRFRGRHIVATFWHGAISIRSGQDFSIEPVGIGSVSFADSEGRMIEREDVHPVVRSEVARLLEEILA